jgi:hypothetical protein
LQSSRLLLPPLFELPHEAESIATTATVKRTLEIPRTI